MANEFSNPNFQINSNNINDPYSLSSGDNPGMSLTVTPFNGLGFLSWSRTVKMALGAKLKLGFINGDLKKPEESDADYQRWIRCDYMVTCWILNSMSSEISNAFVYANSSFELWQEIVERYGHFNGPLLYQLQRDLNEIYQNDSSVVTYFNKLKRCWDEIAAIVESPSCKCGKMKECVCKVAKKYQEIESQSRLKQFLMRLNGSYESVRSQILSMDPLPSVNRDNYIVQQVEKQKSIAYQHDSTAFNVRGSGTFAPESGSFTPGSRPITMGRGSGPRYIDTRRQYDSRNGSEHRRMCTHCHQSGHTYENCFERVGYPDWYKGKKGRRSVKLAANVQGEVLPDTPFDMEDTEMEGAGKGQTVVDPHLIAAVCQEMVKAFKSQGSVNSNSQGNNRNPDNSMTYAGPF